jgi:uncharacterized protein (DUF488 family)
MQRLLCTIGFTGKTAEEFFALLQDAGVEQVIDIRQNRTGQLSGFSKHPDLSFFLKKIGGISYVHEPLLAPPPELLKNYRRNKDWANYETAFLAVMKERGVPHRVDTSSWPGKIVLLCSEPGPEKCHRRLVADLFAAHWRKQKDTVELRHLISAKTTSPKPRRKKARATP